MPTRAGLLLVIAFISFDIPIQTQMNREYSEGGSWPAVMYTLS